MARERVLLVEDDEDIQELVRFNLEKAGYDVTGALSGEEALRLAQAAPPQLVLLDLMLPGLNGLEVCRLLRAEPATARVPIIMVTAKGEEADIVAGLEMGADDYVTKPFSPKVLLARVKAMLRRPEAGDSGDSADLSVHGVEISQGRRSVAWRGEPLDLTQVEFDLLCFLAARPGWVFTRRQIVDAVHGSDYPVTERSVDVQVVGLRRKLGDGGALIETMRGVGYRFKE